ncbi:MAG: GNAT family N-acetyltransferase [Ruminococcus sp.]|nr:GNAT family N-acetyltransferase [Ruminococcus sp.]
MNEQVTIRPVTEADTDRIIAWRNAPSVMAHFIYRTPLTRKAHLNWLHNRVETGEVAQFVIYDGETAVGSVYLRDIDRNNQKCEYGIFIGDEDCRGKGIGTAAAKLALAHAFEELGLNRVYLRVFADNLGAIKSYEKAGFRYEGTFRQDVMIDGVGEDIVFMAILREDWEKGE